MIEFVLFIFGFTILFLLFLIMIMQRRINQLLTDVERLGGKVKVTSSELEALTRNVEEIKKLRF
jgi:cell division protein FtsL